VPIVSTTLGMIVFTNLFLAPLTGPLIRSFKLQAKGEELDERGSNDVTADSTFMGERLTGIPNHGGGGGHSNLHATPLANPLLPTAHPRPTCATAGTADYEQLPTVFHSHASAEATGLHLGAGAPPYGGESSGPFSGRAGFAPPKLAQPSAFHRAWMLIDQSYLKPIFGGRRDFDRLTRGTRGHTPTSHRTMSQSDRTASERTASGVRHGTHDGTHDDPLNDDDDKSDDDASD